MSQKRRRLNEDYFIEIKEPPFPELLYHKKNKIKKEEVIIDQKIETIDDLLDIIKKYKPHRGKIYNFNIHLLHKLKNILIELNNIIGVKNVKKKIVEIIIYYLQDLEENFKNKMHTVIIGPPGSGKTMISKILAKIYYKLGIIEFDKFVCAKRPDLIGKYLGQTSHRTQHMIDRAMGGVLFIDEVYQLGNAEGRDSFSKECIDTINQNLTERQGEFICIIAGYKDSVEKCFFSYNPGLHSRFTMRINMDEYEAGDLIKIYEKNCRDEGWRIGEKLDEEFFMKNKKYFKYSGRDMETLFENTKIVHSKRVFSLPKSEKKKIMMIDVKNAYDLFISNSSYAEEIKNQTLPMMYL